MTLVFIQLEYFLKYFCTKRHLLSKLMLVCLNLFIYFTFKINTSSTISYWKNDFTIYTLNMKIIYQKSIYELIEITYGDGVIN